MENPLDKAKAFCNHAENFTKVNKDRNSMIDVHKALLGVIYDVSHVHDEAVNCLQSDVAMQPGEYHL